MSMSPPGPTLRPKAALSPPRLACARRALRALPGAHVCRCGAPVKPMLRAPSPGPAGPVSLIAADHTYGFVCQRVFPSMPCYSLSTKALPNRREPVSAATAERYQGTAQRRGPQRR